MSNFFPISGNCFPTIVGELVQYGYFGSANIHTSPQNFEEILLAGNFLDIGMVLARNCLVAGLILIW